MLTITVQLTSKLAALRNKLTGPPMQRLLKQTGDDIVAQVRRNIMTEGKSTGSFAQLSGWNQGARLAAKARNKQRKGGFVEPSASSKARDRHTAKHGVSKHAGYAREKEIAHEEGRSAFGPDVKLRYSEKLVQSLVGVVVMDSRSSRAELHAEGTYPNGTAVDEVLGFHVHGTEKMPARNPTANMAQVEARFADRLKRLVSSVTGEAA